MNKESFEATYNIMKKSIQTIFLDNSFLLVLCIILFINMSSLFYFDEIFTKEYHHSFTDTLSIISIFSTIILMIYAGYLANKFFISELEENRLSSLFMLPDGINTVYIGKTIAALITLILLVLLSVIDIYLSLRYWGVISYLTISRILVYSVSTFLASCFVFFLSIAIGFSTKKGIISMLFAAVYVVISFFIGNLIFYPAENSNTYVQILVLPYLNIRYAGLFIEKFGSFPEIFLLIPTISVAWAFIISYVQYRGVRI